MCRGWTQTGVWFRSITTSQLTVKSKYCKALRGQRGGVDQIRSTGWLLWNIFRFIRINNDILWTPILQSRLSDAYSWSRRISSCWTAVLLHYGMDSTFTWMGKWSTFRKTQDNLRQMSNVKTPCSAVHLDRQSLTCIALCVRNCSKKCCQLSRTGVLGPCILNNL